MPQPRRARKKPVSKPLEETEQRLILERIARESTSDTARIAAIKALRSFEHADETEEQGGFEALDELAPRRDRRAS